MKLKPSLMLLSLLVLCPTGTQRTRMIWTRMIWIDRRIRVSRSNRMEWFRMKERVDLTEKYPNTDPADV
jgi:hypothetical protein